MNKELKRKVCSIDIVSANGDSYHHSVDYETDESTIEVEIVPFGEMKLGTVSVTVNLMDDKGFITCTEYHYAMPMSVAIYYETEAGLGKEEIR